jgi:carbamoyl-phosphate synthase large subunit
MPKRDDLKKILVLGSGGIVIGQACEFDYSGTQAIRALKAEGYEVVLVNSNPATIMTDPELSDRTYIEPLTVPTLRRIIKKERPCAILPTVGGQTALNLAVELCQKGVLEEFGVELLGASLEAIELAEDRQRFREAMIEAGLDVPSSTTVKAVDDACDFADTVGYPVIVRPSFTLGGSGGGFAHDREELQRVAAAGLQESPTNQVLVEESISGWKEFEVEVVRDRADNFVVVCSIENLDPMGIHTGDSITVAPAITLTDPEYQRIRNWSRQIMNIVGVETGGSNVQFAVHPETGRLIVIEMNPRVSRSSALASKATGFPIAKVAARLAVGYTLDELSNEITGTTPCSFEPALDYVVVKVPRWDFAKFPGAERKLGPAMKSVGEVMAIGRSFLEAFQKAFRSLEVGFDGLPSTEFCRQDLSDALKPSPHRLLSVMTLMRESLVDGHVPDETLVDLHEMTKIDPWFLDQLAFMAEVEAEMKGEWSASLLRKAKRNGFSDKVLAGLSGRTPDEVAKLRDEWNIFPCYQRVDTCAAEFEASTPYLYSSYRATEDEANISGRRKVIILGSGPNRIGQGIEFDYCCVHAAMALRENDIESIMINCNPETVSTDYDTSDRLYFEPLTFEDVMQVIRTEQMSGELLGVVVQMGGQTPLKLAHRLFEAGVKVLGNGTAAIDLCEDREQFQQLLEGLDIAQPAGALADDLEHAGRLAEQLGYPVLLRPSYVLGGRAMAIVADPKSLERFGKEALLVSKKGRLLIDKFLEDAIEADVDCLGDGHDVCIAGILQHIEEAGVHSGDSACVIPPFKITAEHQARIRNITHKLGKALKLVGLMNVQFAIKDDVVYVIEVNPRASRTVPFLAKATARPLARLATHLMLGKTLAEVGFTQEPTVEGIFVKEAMIPFRKFPGCDALLGPEMRSTGEVMGQAMTFGNAFSKAQVAAGCGLPDSGTVLFTVNDFDKPTLLPVAEALHEMGFKLAGTGGTAKYFQDAGLEVELLQKISSGDNQLLNRIRDGSITLVVNTPYLGLSYTDGVLIRRAAIEKDIPLITTTSAAEAAVEGIRSLRAGQYSVRAIQDWLAKPAPVGV